ncbi:MAG: dCTP deaminase [Candidatus Komeilibacteria bacterium CG10_big_fil_rev_8_21_14_0_10_41_13]|uniref:dCTP deaminase, dUMP-forming n=1 Tax=Candidatus Komeilibacteria bacterium CG10_big_fil_rev_8_21_14_0_10_41_13 TaxID=1974476 RepID=A0A2M6WD93_9BACT|nr:MAG: dCTP deaminase [Candidatus Komeilibacteria bacterium CG10_big_fil_rev_8_21_14_0_10_41_13]
MILSDKDIKKALSDGQIIIEPFDKKNIQPASIDLHLDKYFLVFDTSQYSAIDPKKPMDDMMTEVVIEENRPFVLHPGGFALGMIYEKTGVNGKMVGRLEGKSSVGRMGLLIHVTAGFLDPGNCLKMTLELHNTSTLPILLYYKMPIAQMAFEELTSECERPYSKEMGSKYVGDLKPRASQMWKNFQ